jgi:hypothetical protein
MKLCKMDDYILHFLTGTMAFRSSRPPDKWKDANVLGAILEIENKFERKAAKDAAHARGDSGRMLQTKDCVR